MLAGGGRGIDMRTDMGVSGISLYSLLSLSVVVRQNSIWYKNVMSFKFGPDLIGVFSGRERSF
jgi:hypothetical protein